MLRPLYTADEMRAAEEGHDVDELMERAGRAVADEGLRRHPDARRIVGVCGGGANGGDGRIALRVLREAGRDAEESDDLDDADVLPSGVDASTGEVAGAAVLADSTVTFHGVKVGLEVAPGRFHAGEVSVADIGLAARDTEHHRVTREVLRLVPRRQAGDNKYAASVLVLGGAPGLTGAACLTADAAFRADAGYVAVVAPA